MIPIFFPDALKKSPTESDIKYVGLVVPLPNRYESEMPQGQDLLWISVCNRFFIIENKLKQEAGGLDKSLPLS